MESMMFAQIRKRPRKRKEIKKEGINGTDGVS